MNSKRYLWMGLTVAWGLTATLAGPALGQLACGGVLQAGTYQMTADILACTSDPALTLKGSAVLDMGAHQITCLDNSTNGVVLNGEATSIRNGKVSGCNHGLNLAGEGKHMVINMVLTDNGGDGLQATSARNTLTNIHASGNGSAQIRLASDGNKVTRCNMADGDGPGLYISGSKNKVVESVARANQAHGFHVDSGSGTSFKQCLAVGNSPDGFHIVGSSNKLTFNTAVSNTDDGFSVEGSDSKVSKNTATGNDYGFFTGNDFECDACKFSANNATDNTRENFDGGGTGMVFSKNHSKGGHTGMSLGPEGNATVTETTAIGNTVLGASEIGINIYGPSVTVIQNIVVGSGTFDLQDDDTMCTMNSWADNLYATRDAGCEQ